MYELAIRVVLGLGDGAGGGEGGGILGGGEYQPVTQALLPTAETGSTLRTDTATCCSRLCQAIPYALYVAGNWCYSAGTTEGPVLH